MRSTPSHRIRHASLLLFIVLLVPAPSRADWPASPSINLSVCVASGAQTGPQIVTDRAGGAFIAWSDRRSGESDLYASHVLADGSRDPDWPANGLALCTAPGAQTTMQLVPDGTGGILVAWSDFRNGTTSDIYALRVRADGSLAPGWPSDGIAVCVADSNQRTPAVASDGSGGAIVSWHDLRVGPASDIYAHHIRFDGSLDPAWPTSGLAVCTSAGSQTVALSITDVAGNAILTWSDARGGPTDVYAQRVLVSGMLDPTWPAQGVLLCGATGNQFARAIVSDAAGGAFVGWVDARSGNDDIYATRLLSHGAVDPVWPVDGAAVCSAPSLQTFLRMVSSAPGEVCLAWSDFRGGDENLYAQRLNASGAALWSENGRPVGVGTGAQGSPDLVADGTGGVVVAWNDSRSGNYNIHAQHVFADGSLDPAWGTNGNFVCTATERQIDPRLIADGSGGAVVTWTDHRTLLTTDSDIFAQRIGANGQLGGTVVGVAPERDLALTLHPVRPSPARTRDLAIAFTLATAGDTSLEMFDVAGRRAWRRALGVLGPGQHSIASDLDPSVPSGVHFVVLRHQGEARSQRLVLLD